MTLFEEMAPVLRELVADEELFAKPALFTFNDDSVARTVKVTVDRGEDGKKEESGGEGRFERAMALVSSAAAPAGIVDPKTITDFEMPDGTVFKVERFRRDGGEGVHQLEVIATERGDRFRPGRLRKE